MYARNARIYEKYTFCIHEKDPFLNILLYLLNRPLFTSQSSTFFGKMHSSCIARHWLLGGFISWNRLVLIVGLTYLQRNNVYQNCSFMNLNLVYEFQPRLGLWHSFMNRLLHSFMNWLLHSFMNFTAFLYEFHCIPLWISLHSFMNFNLDWDYSVIDLTISGEKTKSLLSSRTSQWIRKIGNKTQSVGSHFYLVLFFSEKIRCFSLVFFFVRMISVFLILVFRCSLFFFEVLVLFLNLFARHRMCFFCFRNCFGKSGGGET